MSIDSLPKMIVSGGQTGVDRAALDVALEAGLSVGGWCPRGRLAEDGPIDARYPLQETPSEDAAQRTEWNVRDSDGTLVLLHGEPVKGTANTLDSAALLGKPLLALEIEVADPMAARLWVRLEGIRVLNVAGPRESEVPGIYRMSREFLSALLGRVENRP